MKWTECVEKLRQEIAKLTRQCRKEIEDAYASIYEKLGKDKKEKLAALAAIESNLTLKVQEANCPFEEEPRGKLAEAIFALCMQGSTDIPRIFDYHVTVSLAHLNDCLETEFGTNVRELTELNRCDTGVLGEELERLKEELYLQITNGAKREQALREKNRQLKESHEQECEKLKAEIQNLFDIYKQLEKTMLDQRPSTAQPQRNPHSKNIKNVQQPIFPPLPDTPRMPHYGPNCFQSSAAFGKPGPLPDFPGPPMYQPGVPYGAGPNLPTSPGAALFSPGGLQPPPSRQSMQRNAYMTSSVKQFY
jgi:hypothetical protein